MPIPAIISAVGGLMSAGANALSNRAANNRSWRQTKELFGMQQADRNSQNVYNSPANQVAMLKSAGLSPASFYGGAAQNAGSAGIATPNSPEVTPTDFAAPIGQVSGAIGNLTMLGAQKRNIQADTDKKISEVASNYADTAKTQFEYEMAKTLKQTTIEQAQANLDKTIQDTSLSRAQEILSRVDADYRRVGISLTKSQIGLNEKQKSLWDAEIKKIGFDIQESLSRIHLNASQANLADTTARQLCFEIEHLMPAMVADYAASADLKTTQAWDSQENARFQQWYNENMLEYLPQELVSKIRNMDKDTKVKAQQNVRDWIKLPAEFVRDAGIGIGAMAKPITELFGSSPAKIGF